MAGSDPPLARYCITVNQGRAVWGFWGAIFADPDGPHTPHWTGDPDRLLTLQRRAEYFR